MKLVLMQPYFLPYLGYFQLVEACDKFVFYDDVNYMKGGWVNRNRILQNNKAAYISAPLKGASPHTLIKDTLLVENPIWKNKMLKTLKFSYSQAPFFDEVYPILEDIINHSCTSISQLSIYGIQVIARYLGLNKEFSVSSKIYSNQHLKGKNRVIDICHIEDCTTYVNAINGRVLYDVDEFNKEGIRLKFIKMGDGIVYQQFNNDYISHLSIVDVLMFNSSEQIQGFLKEYTLVE